MANFRRIRPYGMEPGWAQVSDEGTLNLGLSMPPGPLCVFDLLERAAEPADTGSSVWSGLVPAAGIVGSLDPSPAYTPPLVINKDAFYAVYCKEGPPFGELSTERKAGLYALLDRLCADPEITDTRWIAYMLATTIHECRSLESQWQVTWRPVSETNGANMSYGQRVIVTDWHGSPLGIDGRPIKQVAAKTPQSERVGNGYYHASALQRRRYYGRGYVQITHQDNYRAMDDALGLSGSLLLNPDRALEPEIAYRIMSYGMRAGSFRGKRNRDRTRGFYGGHKLSDFIGGPAADYERARDIINGDRSKYGALIAGYARVFGSCLDAARRALNTSDRPLRWPPLPCAVWRA